MTEGCWYACFNTGISTPPTHQVHVISRRLCSGWLRPGSASAHVCSGLLTHLTRYRKLLTRGPKRPPFPNLFPLHFHNLCQPEFIPRQLFPSARLHANTNMQGHFLASYFRVFDVVLCGLPWASCSIMAVSLLPSHLFSPIFSPIFSQISSLVVVR